MPRQSLFSGSGSSSNQTLLKEENASTAKKEISNSIKNGNVNVSFMNKIEKKPEPIKDIIIEDDGEDWSAVPAFLRRKK